MKSLKCHESESRLHVQDRHRRLLCISFSLLFLAIPGSTNSQSCNGSLGDPAINQTFGTRGYMLPANSTVYQFVGGCPNAGGTYTLNDFLFGCGPQSWVQMVGDHTPNDSQGNYMLVNASNTPGTVYTDTARNLCGNTVYQFGMWATSVMTNFACNGTPVLPNIKYTVKTLSGIILGQDSTGNLPIVTEKDWKYYGLSVITPTNVTDVIISITINPPNGCGAAFAIDDITLSPCSPSTITANINGGPGPVDVCADYTDVWVLNAIYTPGINNPAFQWQTSVDFGGSWSDIPGATTITYTAPHRTSGTVLYRVCMAEQGNINTVNCRITSNIIRTAVHPLPAPVPPREVIGCTGKDFYFPTSDPSALQVLWTGPNGYTSSDAIAYIPNVQYSDTGMYRLKETFYFGCILYDTFYLKVYPGTSVSVLPVGPLCEGQSVTLFAMATDSVGYNWTPSTGLSNDAISQPIAAPRDSITYKVVTTNRYGCQDSAYANVFVYKKPVANAGADKSILIGDTAILNGSFNGTSTNFFWTPAIAINNTALIDPLVYPPQTFTYTLHVESTLGCGVATDDVTVKVFNDIYIPNAFTPNNDGRNDRFQIPAFENYKITSLHIYNRWGEKVYRAIGNSNGWDGTFDGLLQPQGIYVYHLEIQSANGRKIFRKGTITLVR